MESHIWPCCQLFGQWAQQRNHGFCQHFCLGERCPFRYFPKASQFSSSLYVPGAFELLPQYWSSEQVSVNESMHGPLGGTAWDSRSLCLTQLQSWMVFIARSYSFSSQHWSPRLGSLVWGLDFSFLRGDPCSWAIATNFHLPHMGVGPACSTPLLSVFTCLLLYILSHWTFVQLDFGSLSVMVVL